MECLKLGKHYLLFHASILFMFCTSTISYVTLFILEQKPIFCKLPIGSSEECKDKEDVALASCWALAIARNATSCCAHPTTFDALSCIW